MQRTATPSEPEAFKTAAAAESKSSTAPPVAAAGKAGVYKGDAAGASVEADGDAELGGGGDQLPTGMTLWQLWQHWLCKYAT